jgi:cytochrome P450
MDFMHNGAGHYENQEEFIPERFIDDDKTMSAASNGKFSERDQFNFGWGRRICPGIYLVSSLKTDSFYKLNLFSCIYFH